MSSVGKDVEALIEKDVRGVVAGLIDAVAAEEEAAIVAKALLGEMVEKLAAEQAAEQAVEAVIARNMKVLLGAPAPEANPASEQVSEISPSLAASAVPAPSSDAPDQELQGILDAQKELYRIRQSIEEIVFSIVNNPTLLHKMAMTYSQISEEVNKKLGKIAGGTVAGGSLIAGVAICGPSLMTAAAIIILCGGGHFAFDEYGEHIKKVEKKAEGIAGLYDGVINQIMTNISNLYVRLNAGFIRFQEKEQQFQCKIFEQGRQVDRLMGTIEQLDAESATLRKTVEAQNKLVAEAQSQLGENNAALALRQKELDDLLARFHATQESLESRNVELTLINSQLAAQTQASQRNIESLTKVVAAMAAQQKESKKKEEDYQKKMEGAIDGVKATFDAASGQVSQTVHAITRIQATLEANIKLHEELREAEAAREARFREFEAKRKLAAGQAGGKVGSGLPGLNMWQKQPKPANAAAQNPAVGAHL